MKKLNQRQKGDDTDGPCGCYECMPDIGGYKMKHKKLFLGLGAGILAVAIAVGVAFYANSRGNAVRPEDVARAATARQLLLSFYGEHPLAEDVPDSLVGRYIDEDCKLQIRLHESAKDKEAAIIEALGEYADIAEFNYLSVTERELQVRAADVTASLQNQGYADASVGVNSRTGDILIFLSPEAVAEAEAWVREQTAYPFDDVGVRYIFPENEPWRIRSIQAKDVLAKALRAVGGHREYYCGSYIGMDGKLHVVIKENISKEQRASLESYLKDYSDLTVYEYGGYDREEILKYSYALMDALEEMGILVTGGTSAHLLNIPSVNVYREDIYAAQILLESDLMPLFNGKKIAVILSPGSVSYE